MGVHSRGAEGLLQVLSQHNRAAASSATGGSTDKDGKKSSTSSTTAVAQLSLPWTNADLDLLVDPVRGAWESAKLHGLCLGR